VNALVLALAAAAGGTPPAVEDPSRHALDGFFTSLARTEAGDVGTLTRVVHMGDSSIGLDGIPHAIRKRMQARFGDGGAGFVLLQQESDNYRNRAAHIDGRGWSICYIAVKCDKQGHYGLGGHAFRGRPGARTRIKPRKKGAVGREIARVELWYAARPKGGRLALEVEGEPVDLISTAAEAPEDRWHEVWMDPGPHAIELREAGHGKARAYGMVLEAEGPGIVWDTVSMIGAFTTRLHEWDEAHLAAQIEHRDPDLLVLEFGGNDLRRFATTSVDARTYAQEYRKAIRMLRRGKKSMSCLVVSIVDHARAGKREIARRWVVGMVGAQREAAHAEGCAFFDAVAAMGGPGSIRRWWRLPEPLASPDLQHLSAKGRDRMGEMIYGALVNAYERWQSHEGVTAPSAR
jgi:lysophospholipase L1-like esterase